MNLSHQASLSINNVTPKESYAASPTSQLTQQLTTYVLMKLGPSTLLVKILLLMHPTDCHLLTMEQKKAFTSMPVTCLVWDIPPSYSTSWQTHFHKYWIRREHLQPPTTYKSFRLDLYWWHILSTAGMVLVFVQPTHPLIITSTLTPPVPEALELSLLAIGSNYHGQYNGLQTRLNLAKGADRVLLSM